MIQYRTDAAWAENEKWAGLAWITNDAEGKPLGKASNVANFVGSPFIAEAMAIFEAVLHAKLFLLPKVKILSDAMNVVKAIDTRKPPKEAYEIINGILSLSSSFNSISFVFVLREENKLVDELAKKALRSVTISHM